VRRSVLALTAVGALLCSTAAAAAPSAPRTCGTTSRRGRRSRSCRRGSTGSTTPATSWRSRQRAGGRPAPATSSASTRTSRHRGDQVRQRVRRRLGELPADRPAPAEPHAGRRRLPWARGLPTVQQRSVVLPGQRCQGVPRHGRSTQDRERHGDGGGLEGNYCEQDRKGDAAGERRDSLRRGRGCGSARDRLAEPPDLPAGGDVPEPPSADDRGPGDRSGPGGRPVPADRSAPAHRSGPRGWRSAGTHDERQDSPGHRTRNDAAVARSRHPGDCRRAAPDPPAPMGRVTTRDAARQ